MFGGDGDDEIYGADEGDEDLNFTDTIWFGDVIEGGAGNDKIVGLGGADYIVGGSGDDDIDGGDHGDWISGGDGDDRLNAGIQSSIGPGDQVMEITVNDLIVGSHRADSLYAEPETIGLKGETEMINSRVMMATTKSMADSDRIQFWDNLAMITWWALTTVAI